MSQPKEPEPVTLADDTFVELCQSLTKTTTGQRRELERLWRLEDRRTG